MFAHIEGKSGLLKAVKFLSIKMHMNYSLIQNEYKFLHFDVGLQQEKAIGPCLKVKTLTSRAPECVLGIENFSFERQRRKGAVLSSKIKRFLCTSPQSEVIDLPLLFYSF